MSNPTLMPIFDTAVSLPRADAFSTIAVGGLTAGLLDGLDAVFLIGMIHHIPAAQIFQFIASGLLGLSAFQGGAITALVGVGLHFLIAIGAASVFYALSRRLPVVLRRPWLFGPIFGLCVFLFMHYLVVPLSATPKPQPLELFGLLNLLASHIFFVGLPIALVASRSARR